MVVEIKDMLKRQPNSSDLSSFLGSYLYLCVLYMHAYISGWMYSLKEK